MWLFTPDFYVSAVVHFADPEVVVVRARRRQHLLNLIERHQGERVGMGVVVEATPRNDYPYRIALLRDEWADVVSFEALAMVHTNYKAAAGKQGFADMHANAALHNVWSALHVGLTERPAIRPTPRQLAWLDDEEPLATTRKRLPGRARGRA